MNKAVVNLLALGLASFLVLGCQAPQSEKDLLAETQYCLDEARDGLSAKACVSKISGIVSPQASALRCAAGFIEAQVASPEKLSLALNAISENGGAPTLLSTLSFPSTQLANETFAECNASKQNGLKLIAAMAKSATLVASVSSNFSSCQDISCAATEMDQTLSDIAAGVSSLDPTEKAQAEEVILGIVTTVQTVYASTCGGANYAGSDICKQINDAISTSSFDISTTDQSQLLQIGLDLINQWKTN